MSVSLSNIGSMSRTGVLCELKRFFDIRELVCPDVYSAQGRRSWEFLDTDLLRFLLWVRLLCGRPVTVNTWHRGGCYDERGLRCNLCALVKSKSSCYLSMHIFGKAVDFTVEGLSAQEVRDLIQANVGTVPCNLRLESDVSWVHADVRASGDGVGTVSYFKG